MTKYSELSEISLIKKSQKGDTKAFEELMSQSKDYLSAWIRRKTQNENEMEEILQITYIKCWKYIKSFQCNSKFKTWACSVSRNLFIDSCRKRERNRETSLEESDGAFEFTTCTKHEGFNSLKSKDESAELLKILDQLPKIHRDVLSCFAIEELTYREIAKKLGCALGTVMSRLYYARKKAQRLIERNSELKYHGNDK
jgi:RNA polymerase sigma-70 factor (ECF subfamily)